MSGLTNAANTGDLLQVTKNWRIFAYTPIPTVSEDRGDLTEGLSTTDILYKNLVRFFGERVSSLGIVEKIYMSFFDKEIDIWTIVNEDSEKARKQLYEIEVEILAKFQEFVFDFHIYALTDINLDEFEKDSKILRIYPH